MIHALQCVFRKMGSPQPVNKPVGVEKPTKCHYFFFTVTNRRKKIDGPRATASTSIQLDFTVFHQAPHGRESLLIRHTTTQYYIKTVQRAHMLAGQRYSQDDTLYVYNAHTLPLCSNTCTSGEGHRRPYCMLLFIIIYYEKKIETKNI